MSIKIKLPISAYDIQKALGKETWKGVVLGRKKTDGSSWALKFYEPSETARKQAEERSLTLEEFWRKEVLGGLNRGYTNLAFNTLERADNGTVFLAEEYIDRFLSDYLEVQPSLTRDEVLSVAKGLAQGLADMHRHGFTHGDLKPENIGYTLDEIVKISDYGTSSVFSKEQKNRRDNMGHLQTRAPENFREGSKPTPSSDVWSFGAMIYRLITGEYPFEEELKNNPDYFKGINEGSLQKNTISSRLKQLQQKGTSQELQCLIEDCLQPDPRARPSDGSEVVKRLTQLMPKEPFMVTLGKSFKRHLGWLVPVAALSLSWYAAATHEPSKLAWPEAEQVGPMEMSSEKEYQVKRENLGQEPITCFIGFDQLSVKCATNDKRVAYLLQTHDQAWHYLGVLRSPERKNNAQISMWCTYTPQGERFPGDGGNDYRVIAKAIEVGLSEGMSEDGALDLEDALTISRVGVKTLRQAQKAANSFEFMDYIAARNSSGEYIIPEKEQRFIKTWLRLTFID